MTVKYCGSEVSMMMSNAKVIASAQLHLLALCAQDILRHSTNSRKRSSSEPDSGTYAPLLLLCARLVLHMVHKLFLSLLYPHCNNLISVSVLTAAFCAGLAK